MGTALVLSFGFGVPLGSWQAAHRGIGYDRVAGTASLVVGSLAGILARAVLLLLFAARFPILPSHGAVDPMHDSVSPRRTRDRPRSSPGAASPHTRAAQQCIDRSVPAGDVAGRPAPGLRPHGTREGRRERHVLWKHALRNALVPTIVLAGLSLPALIGGAVFVERIFSWPGMGSVAVEAFAGRDYQLVAVRRWPGRARRRRIVADLLHAVADPRVRALSPARQHDADQRWPNGVHVRGHITMARRARHARARPKCNGRRRPGRPCARIARRCEARRAVRAEMRSRTSSRSRTCRRHSRIRSVPTNSAATSCRASSAVRRCRCRRVPVGRCRGDGWHGLRRGRRLRRRHGRLRNDAAWSTRCSPIPRVLAAHRDRHAVERTRSSRASYCYLGSPGGLGCSRLVRTLVMSAREDEFVTAARALGATTPHSPANTFCRRSSHRCSWRRRSRSATSSSSKPASRYSGWAFGRRTASWGSVFSDGMNSFVERWWMSVSPARRSSSPCSQ